VVAGVKNMTVGAIGARTTPFKTVRIDEVALQKHGVTVETLDLSTVITQARKLTAADASYKAHADRLKSYASWDGVPSAAFENLVKFSATLDQIIKEYQMDAVAIRCWTELGSELGITPCVAMSLLNEIGLAAACEVDIGNAVIMRALALASAGPVALLDWNNNYGEDDDKCILFHCSAVPKSMMTGKGSIKDHVMLARVLGDGNSFGCNAGRIAPGDFTYGGLMTQDGKVKCYLGEGTITNDPIAPDFFGCAGVAKIERLQDVLLYLGRTGHRHHVAMTRARVREPLHEALEKYVGFCVDAL
jgi:L-fucose isomerase-like protein